MATTLQWIAPEAVQTALTTELNSLANGALTAASGAVDNTTGLYEYIAFEVALASLTPTGTPYLGIYIFYSHDGTTYEDVSINAKHALAATLPVTTGSGTKLVVSRAVLLLPLKFKLALENETAVSLAASSNTLKYRRWNEQAV